MLLRRQELAVSRALRVALRRHWETTAEEEDDLGGAGVSKEAQWVPDWKWRGNGDGDGGGWREGYTNP